MGAGRCQRRRRKPGPRDAAAGRAGPGAGRASRGRPGSAGLGAWARGGFPGGERLAPRKPRHRRSRGSGFTPRAPPETAPSRAPKPGGGTRLSAPAPGDSGPAPGPERRPARPSAHRSAPQPRLLRRRLPGLGAGPRVPPRPPHSRAPGALGAEPSARAPRHGCRGRRAPGRAAAAREALARAGPARAGGVGWGVGEPRGGRDGTRRAPKLGRREEEKPQRHQSPRRRGWGGGKRGPPSLCQTPISGPPRSPHPHAPLRGMAALRVAPGLPSHPGPDSAEPSPARPLGALTCSSRF